MNSLIALPSPIEEVRTHPEMLAAGSYNDGAQDWHLYMSTEDTSASYAGSKLLGQWNEDGSVPEGVTIDADYTAFVNPAGNASGEAPETVAIINWLGHHPERAIRELIEGDETLPYFPADNQPFIVRVARTVILDDGYPQIPHGFTFMIEFADPTRAPDARSFGVYSDAGCTQYLWTPGAFSLIDGVWTINCPVGQRTAEPQDWHFAMLFGAAQEGRFTLSIGQQSETRYFFEHDQGYEPPPSATWHDSGETVTGMAGTVTLVSNITPFPVDTLTRINGFESTVTSTWAGQGLVLTPYHAHSTGAIIEVYS